jgi:hypothetical protein
MFNIKNMKRIICLIAVCAVILSAGALASSCAEDEEAAMTLTYEGKTTAIHIQLLPER